VTAEGTDDIGLYYEGKDLNSFWHDTSE